MFDELRRIWREHGYHAERTDNLWAYGAAGREAIAAAVEGFRRDPPRALGGLPVVRCIDRREPRSTGSPTRDLRSNVLVFELGTPGGARCTLVVRASGTEPKAKIYALASGEGGSTAAELDAQIVAVDAVIGAVLADARARAEAIMAPIVSGHR